MMYQKEELERQNVKELDEKKSTSISEMLPGRNLDQIDSNEGQQDHTERIKAFWSNDRFHYKMSH